MAPRKLMDHPLPSLAQWLGDGTRAEGYEEWLRENIAIEAAVVDPDEKAAVRLIRTLSVACMEAAKQERELHGRSDAQTVQLLARAAGVAVMCPVLSLCSETPRAPLLKLARMLADDFSIGAKSVARSAERQEDGAA